MEGNIRQGARPEVELLQVREISAGDSVGYIATFTAERPMRVGVLNLGYADGYLRGFSGQGRALAGERALPVLGRVSMDLTVIDLAAAPDLREGDHVNIAVDSPRASRQPGLTRYKLLTGLGLRYHHVWASVGEERERTR